MSIQIIVNQAVPTTGDGDAADCELPRFDRFDRFDRSIDLNNYVNRTLPRIVDGELTIVKCRDSNDRAPLMVLLFAEFDFKHD